MSNAKATDKLTSHLDAQKRLRYAFMLGVLYVVIVFSGGLYAGSLSLVADSVHMVAHSAALFVALIASAMAQRTQVKGQYQRTEALGGYSNGLLLCVIGVMLCYEASTRLWEAYQASVEAATHAHHEHDHDHERHAYDGHIGHEGHSHKIDASLMGMIALIGLVLHALSAWILYGGRKQSLNVYALYLHIFYDVAATLLTLGVSIAIAYTEMTWLDGLASLGISLLIIRGAIKMLCRSGRIITGKLPDDLSVDHIRTSILGNFSHVKDIHHLVIENRGQDHYAMSGHIVMDHTCLEDHHWRTCQKDVEQLLRDKFNIQDVILQVEFSDDCSHHHHH